jgi:L-alanine-DL-glutamate epimerase-like enolase superfamily enzyme
MHIVDVRIQPCTQRLRDPSWKFARATVAQLEGHVLSLTDELGNTGLGYVHAIPAISTHGAGAQAALALLAPVLDKRRVDDLAAIVEEVDAMLAFSPSVKAGIDMALHDLLARRLGVPVHVLLGGRMHDRIAQSRILPIKTPAEMATQAAMLAEEGYGQLKLKLDPNQSYSAKQMMSAFARMERHDIALIEQPVPAADWAGLALLTRTLPVAIEADESAQTVHDVFRLVAERAVDVINLKVTKLGGMRRFMQAVRICEAGNVGCRVGAAFGPSLMQAMSMQAASVVKSLPYACELSEHLHLLDDPFTPLRVDRGSIDVPRVAGCGVDFAASARA